MATTVGLSLVAHTNVGKTTLARTLLKRDVGEVRDAPHVTEFADAHEMLHSTQGDALLLWDTPGFGDSVRLLRRMEQRSNPIGWFLSQVWDRWRDRPFWASQQALRHVASRTDVALYLVNAAESPAAAAYVGPELALLGWVGAPVIVLLNQTGPPRGAAEDAEELRRWRKHLAGHAHVATVLPLDAFSRCWVQEGVLLRAVERCLDGDRRAAMQRLIGAWQADRLSTFGAAVDSIAGHLARIAAARQEVAGSAWTARLRAFGAALGLRDADRDPAALAQAALAAALDDEVRADTARLVALHGLSGQAEGEILDRLARSVDLRLKVDEGKAALIGGAVTGALAGLKADIASGGLTLGGGLIAGGLLGAIGAAGVARCVNLVRGTDRSWIAWNGEALDALFEAALLRYLAVAHFGRGRGEWQRDEAPAHWQSLVAERAHDERESLHAAWSARDPRTEAQAAAERLQTALRPVVDRSLRALLGQLYPDSPVPDAAALAAGAVPADDAPAPAPRAAAR